VTIWIIQTAQHAEVPLTFRIPAGKMKTIGRAAGADFIVDAGMVSRVHCRLSARATDLEVTDLESTNGTYVNGQRVAQALLAHGDQLGVGRVTFRVLRDER
jgi:pSer/pThr/pTyr-binding forkhead associated (FHA) protein